MEASDKLENFSCAGNLYSDQFIFPLELVDLTVNTLLNWIMEAVSRHHQFQPKQKNILQQRNVKYFDQHRADTNIILSEIIF